MATSVNARRFTIWFWIAAVSAFAISVLPAADRYVSTTGSDSNAGSIGAPWLTVGKAAAAANAGDTVFVRGGVYLEKVTLSKSGTSGARIGFRNFEGETPVLDGTGQTVGGETAMIDLAGQDYITIEGFEIRNLATSANSKTPIGILIAGSAVGIEIAECEIHGIENTGSNGNAHGILVAGTSTTPISSLVIRDCLIRDLVLGNSEALVLNGNVDGFKVRGNTVRDCNNIGIDFIGFEDVGPSLALDQARNGVCADNVVHGCSTIGNPAYGEWSCAGIYVDGGRDIIIERNRVYLNDIGIEIASEHSGRSTENITVRDNLIWRNLYGGIFAGGYDSGVGETENCVVAGNTLYHNDNAEDGNGELLVRFKTYGLDVWNNIIVANTQGLLISTISSDTSDLDFDYNLFHTAVTDQWSWQNETWFSGFPTWKSNSGQDANSQFGDPIFISVTGAVGDFDLRVASASPARDSGDPAFVAGVGQADAFGSPRVFGGIVDIGAFEFVMFSEQWRLTHFGTTLNSGDGADAADPDLDGRLNLLELAFGTDPIIADGGSLFSSITEGLLSFGRNPDATEELSFAIYSSDDLAGESWIPIATWSAGGPWTSITNVVVTENGAGLVAVVDGRASTGRRFYRIDVFR